MYFDSHVHSAASPDSEMNPEEAIAASKQMGLGIAFTEHVDYSDHKEKDPNATDALRGLGDFVCDFDLYPAQYKKYRGKGVTLGLEFGLTQAFLQVNAKLAAEYDYDFIIGSIHSVDGVELYHAAHGRLPDEPFAMQLTSHDTNVAEACISRYLTYAKEMVVLSSYFDSFGHIDYIARYLPRLADNFYYEKFTCEFDALLKVIAERELALEINTNLFDGDGTAEKVMLRICNRFAELGGQFCTIGSDAHKVKNIGKCIENAKEIATASGLTAVYYKERKPIVCG